MSARPAIMSARPAIMSAGPAMLGRDGSATACSPAALTVPSGSIGSSDQPRPRGKYNLMMIWMYQKTGGAGKPGSPGDIEGGILESMAGIGGRMAGSQEESAG